MSVPDRYGYVKFLPIKRINETEKMNNASKLSSYGLDIRRMHSMTPMINTENITSTFDSCDVSMPMIEVRTKMNSIAVFQSKMAILDNDTNATEPSVR